MNEIKRTIKFKDANKNKVVAEVELKKEQNGKFCFTMSGDFKNSGGQCFKEVVPSDKYQKQLIKLWNEFHLNSMNAGTQEQTEALKDFKGEYDAQIKHLKSLNLYEVTLKNGERYKYGSAWLHKDLPISFDNDLNLLLDNIVNLDKLRDGENLSEEEQEELNILLKDEKIQALKESLDLCDRDVLTISESEGSYNSNLYEVNGVEYYVLTDGEAEDQCKEYLEKDIWIDCIKADRTTDSFKDWQDEVIAIDGFGQILNGYDGSEDVKTINGTEYFIIRC